MHASTCTQIKNISLVLGGCIVSSLVYASGTFEVSPRTQIWKAISADGQVIRTGHASLGRAYCPDTHRACRTPTGHFSVISKQGAACRSTRYPLPKGGAPMP